MRGKSLSNINNGAVIAVGLVIAIFFPANADAFQSVVLTLSPILLGHMAAIWAGNKDQAKTTPPQGTTNDITSTL